MRAGPSNDRRAMNVKAIEELIKRAGVRTADRANMQRMLKKMKAGQALTTQERENLWAYVNRYSRLETRG